MSAAEADALIARHLSGEIGYREFLRLLGYTDAECALIIAARYGT